MADFNFAAPHITCESHSVSPHSPGIVQPEEKLLRFVFAPMHQHKKTGKILPAVFAHVHEKGCSIQRQDVATDGELETFTRDFLARSEKHAWVGVLEARCADVRAIQSDAQRRWVGVYDTGEEHNTAHAEMCQSQYVIDEADQVELRNQLFKAFNQGQTTEPHDFRDGQVWAALPPELREQSLRCRVTPKAAPAT